MLAEDGDDDGYSGGIRHVRITFALAGPPPSTLVVLRSGAGSMAPPTAAPRRRGAAEPRSDRFCSGHPQSPLDPPPPGRVVAGGRDGSGSWRGAHRGVRRSRRRTMGRRTIAGSTTTHGSRRPTLPRNRLQTPTTPSRRFVPHQNPQK